MRDILDSRDIKASFLLDLLYITLWKWCSISSQLHKSGYLGSPSGLRLYVCK